MTVFRAFILATQGDPQAKIYEAHYSRHRMFGVLAIAAAPFCILQNGNPQGDLCGRNGSDAVGAGETQPSKNDLMIDIMASGES